MPFTISSELIQTLFALSLTVLVAVVVDIILRSLVRIPKSFDTRRSRTYVTILRSIITVIVYAIAFYAILVELGINITPLLASAGIIGITIGLGAKTLIEDLIAGFFLLSQDSLAIGDTVKIDDAEGWIEKISLRTLTIRADTGALFIIPNGQVKKVINFSRHKAHLPIDIPVKADEHISTVLKVTKDALNQLEKDETLADAISPGSSVDGVEDFRSGGPLIVRVTLITFPDRRLEVARKFRFLIKKSFEKHKISLG